MSASPEYKRTLFDRHGPAALDYIRAWAYGAMVFGLTVAAIALRVGFHWWAMPVGLTAGAATAGLGLFFAQSAGGAWKRVMVDGSSTPYVEQYSQQQALVMQGKLDEALASFESMLPVKPDSVDLRIRAATVRPRQGKSSAGCGVVSRSPAASVDHARARGVRRPPSRRFAGRSTQ